MRREPRLCRRSDEVTALLLLRSHRGTSATIARIGLILAAAGLLMGLTACGSTTPASNAAPTASGAPPENNAPVPTPPPSISGVAASSHVLILLEENQNYSNVIGSSQSPYLNSLAAQYALATQYYADAHPSIPNYFMLTTGQTITLDDNFSGTVNADNLVRELAAAGKTWKSYQEDLPSAAYLGGDTGSYVKRHNPFAYFTDVINNPAEAQNIVPFTQFAADLGANSLPNFSFITPNIQDDAHNGTPAQADSWLSVNLPALFANAAFQQDGLLMIVFDESGSDVMHFGGRVPMVLISPKAKHGYQSTTFYQHESALRLMEEALGLKTLIGAAATAPAMGEFFQPTSTAAAKPALAHTAGHAQPRRSPLPTRVSYSANH